MIYGSRWKPIAAASFFITVAIAALLSHDDSWRAKVALWGGSTLCLAGVWGAIFPVTLTLTASGFSVRSVPFKAAKASWADVESFSVWRQPTTWTDRLVVGKWLRPFGFVVWMYRPGQRRVSFVSRMNGFGGFDGHLTGI
ncbi:MAG: hypothetical protein M3N05_09160 [Pseudomonadota bacterium]|nr:hypothetical protein [Pseudomonadota bacterium]